jgi:6-phosphogluconolactonase
MTMRQVLEFHASEYAAQVADLLATGIRATVAAHGRCRIVLAGGRTPASVYRALALYDPMPWAEVTAFIGDERCVPPDDTDSNYRMIAETLLSQVPIPAAQVHRLRGEIDAERSAAEYDAIVGALDAPAFDIVLSGVGADGHTASLFPGDPSVSDATAWAAAATAPAPFAVAARVTLTLRALNSTRVQIVLCRGADKLPVRSAILGDDPTARILPAALLRGLDATLWLVDVV